MRFLLIPALAGLLALPTWAARPFVTDDARLATAGSCQLESWTRGYADSREVWVLPACNPGGNLEITLGTGRTWPEGGPGTADDVFQLKTLFRQPAANDWSLGLAVGEVRRAPARADGRQSGSTYAYLPLSWFLHDDRVIVHVNLGWLRDQAADRDRLTWGWGGEFQLGTPRLALVAETFGDDGNRPWWQTGVRWSWLPNLLQLDATIGQQAGGDPAGRWMSLGLRWTPARFFK